MDKAPYSPDELESIIDSFRFSGNWDAVLGALERYAQVFDIGAAAASKQHWTSDDARCFYWSVMCEAMLEYRGSYQQALICVKKAAGYNHSYPDWRIFLCRILLENSKIEIGETSRNAEEAHLEEFDAAEVLSDAMQSLERTECELLLQNIKSLPKSFRMVLLHVFSVIPSVETVFICQYMLELLAVDSGPSAEPAGCSEHWSLVCCRFVLRQLSLERAQHSYLRGSMSDYRFWLLSDAMVTRSILSEILGDLAVARADILHILRELSPRSIRPAGGMAAPATAAHAETADISSSTIQSLPGPVRRLLLYAAARLPLLEKNMGLAQDAYKSFRHCIGDAAVVILRFAAGLKQGVTRQSDDADHESINHSVHRLRESLDFDDHVGSLGDDVNLESALLLLRSCHEAMSSSGHSLSGRRRAESSSQFVNIELSWGASVVHNVVESDLSIEFLPQSLAKRVPKPLSDPCQLSSIVSPARVAYLMAGIVTKIFRGTDQSSRRDSLTSTESFELLQWGFSNETSPPLNCTWALSCCYLRLPVSAHADAMNDRSDAFLGAQDSSSQEHSFPSKGGGDSFVLPHFFGGEEVDASLELLDQCIAVLLQRRTAESPVHVPYDDEYRSDKVFRYVLPEKVDDEVMHGVDYPALSLWFGLGHQPSRYNWLPYSLAADLCLYMLEDGPRSLHYATTGLRSLYSHLHGCDVCLQVLGSDDCGNITGRDGAVPDSAALATQLLHPMGHRCQVPAASTPEGYAKSSRVSKEAEADIIHFLACQTDCGRVSTGTLKLFYSAAKAHACWGRSSAMLMPERLAHRRIALRSLSLMLTSMKVFIEEDGKITVKTDVDRPTTVSTDEVLLEYCTLLGEVGEIARAILLSQSAVALFPCSEQLLHLFSNLLDSTCGEAMTASIHEKCARSCERAMQLAKQKGDIWKCLNCKLTFVNVLWKFQEQEKAIREIDDLLAELHRLTLTGNLMAHSYNDALGAFIVIHRHHSRYFRGSFIIESLLTASSLFRLVRNTERAKACVEDAWRLLFASRDILSSGGSGGGLVWGHGYDEKFKVPSFNVADALGTDASETSKINAISENAAQILQNHTYWMDNLKSVPTFEGWRLSEASGWNVDSIQRRMWLAAVAVETAEILKLETNNKAEALTHLLGMIVKKKTAKRHTDVDAFRLARERDILMSSCIEFSNIAVSIDPRNVKVLTAAARLQLYLSSEDNAALGYAVSCTMPLVDHTTLSGSDTHQLDIGNSLRGSTILNQINIDEDLEDMLSGNGRVLKAMSLAAAALEYDDVYVDAWFALGQSFEKLGQVQQAAECYVRALERANFNPSRYFSVALY